MIRENDLDKAFYEIQVKGYLDARWNELFEGMNIAGGDNVTTISGIVADQAALHGLLARVRDYGLVLISIRSNKSNDGRPQRAARTVAVDHAPSSEAPD
ncbi:MAG TPA: hypothetical protein VF088_20685 [Pyrinomonadaceae bacterium]